MAESRALPVAASAGGIPAPEIRREEARTSREITDAALMECFYTASDRAAALRGNSPPAPGEARYQQLRMAEEEANQSFSLLCAHYTPALRRKFDGHLLIDNVEEMVQETWVAVCATARSHTARYRPDFRFATWLFRIARNIRSDHAIVREKTDIELMETLNGACSPDDRSRAETSLRRRYLAPLEREFRKAGAGDPPAKAKATLERALGVLSDTFDPARQQFVVWLAEIARGLMDPTQAAARLAEYIPRAGLSDTEALEECEICRDGAASNPEEQAIRQERRDVLSRCLCNLTPAQQRVVDLIWRQDHTPAEAAHILRRAIGRIHNVLTEARQRLRECVQAHFGLATDGG